tara:strand:+ start:29 stop:814 length:786 start_codon:yes stop_codon:yes gene_type:complete
MKEFFKKVVRYTNSLNNKNLDLLKEIIFYKLNKKIFNDLKNIEKEKIFNLLIELKGTSLVEGIYIVNSLFETIKLNGDVCEFGVAQGKTSKLIGYIINDIDKKLYLFDSFKGLPKPSKEDQLKDDIFNLKNISNYEGKMSHEEYKVVNELNYIKFNKKKLIINKGFFNKENINKFNIPKEISFVYLDFDFYEPTKDVLNLISNILVPGGIIIVDDYDFFSTGVKTAVDEWISKNQNNFLLEKIKTDEASFVIIKKNKTIET